MEGRIDTNTLLVIDDTALREKAFARLEAIIKTIEQIEARIQAFYSHDQDLFNKWQDRAFAQQRSMIAGLQDRLAYLVRFHNWVIAFSEIKDISLPESLIFLRDEEDRYECGSIKEKHAIDEERIRRDEWIQRRAQEQFEKSRDRDRAFEDFMSDDSEERKLNYVVFERLREMSEDEIKDVLKGKSEAFHVLELILQIAKNGDHAKTFIRFWNHVPPEWQVEFSNEFADEYGVDFKVVLGRLKQAARKDSRDQSREKKSKKEAKKNQSNKPASGEKLELLKMIYRKIVRKIHPDMKNDITDWHKSLWLRVQECYQGGNLRELKKLFTLILIREKNLHDLSMSDLNESQVWLNEEAAELEKKATGIKKSPAWGFSEKKDLTALTRKIDSDFTASYVSISEQVEEIEFTHSELEKEWRSMQMRPRRSQNSSASSAARS